MSEFSWVGRIKRVSRGNIVAGTKVYNLTFSFSGDLLKLMKEKLLEKEDADSKGLVGKEIVLNFVV